jgi:uncharacterized metal-binding protein
MMSGGLVLATLLTWNPDVLYLTAGSLLGIFFTPDLDVDNGFLTDQWIRQRLGSVAEWIWKQFWYPYRRSLKHGGPLSHFPGLGTAGRIVYVYVMLIGLPSLILFLLYRTWGYGWNILGELDWWWGWILLRWKIWLGLATADTLHFCLDVLTTEHKNKHSPK